MTNPSEPGVQLNTDRRRPLHGRPATCIVLVLVLIGGAAATVERQNIFDWWRLHNYQPPVAVQQLASDTTMTDYAQHIFYINHPAIDAKTAFTSECPNNGGEKTIVLGCYHSDEQGIFVLSVSDSRLQGVEQVTAAHEMLHAAYSRLSTKDKNYVDGLLMDYYEHDLHDKRLLDTIAAYKKSEPHDVVNEMHSVFGTEVANLPAPLETYYKRYFTDRRKITTYETQYESAFTNRENQVTQDDARLAQLKQAISTDEVSLQSQQQTITDDQNRLAALKRSSNYAAYNDSVPVFNDEVDNYNSLVATVHGLISQYNQLVGERNAIALEEDQLEQDIAAAPSQIK